MSICVCIISSNDVSREGLAHFLRSDGYVILSSIFSANEIEHTSERFLAVIDEPDAALQCAAVDDLKAHAPNALAVILAERFDMDTMVACFRSGAQGYIVKSIRAQPLMAALRLAALGEKVMPSDLANAFDSRQVTAPIDLGGMDDANLSPRERDVLCCLMAGYPNKHIARQLSVCEATVKVHVKAILRKLKVRNRTQAAIWASSNGVSENRYPELA
jgi:two-component system, NarL family, nitrate/nitrite response regulator NarL